MEGPDQGWAWAVAFAGLMLNFIVAGLGRMSGIMYVSFIEMFHLDRKGASTPFSVRSSMRNLLGPVVGILGQKYGVQKVILVGSVISTLSAACCFFAHDIFWITFLWGGLGGAGAALTMCIVQVRIGQYFEKYRTTAAGMGFSGGCVGSFLFPALLEVMLLEYGMEGTFLLMSGVIMHCIPAAMILRKPPWMPRRKKIEKTKKVLTSSSNELVKLEDGIRITKINDLDRNNSNQYSSNKDLRYCPDVQFLQQHNKLVIKLLTLKLPDDSTTDISQEKNQNAAPPVIETCIQETMEDLYYKQLHSSQKNQLNQNSKLSKNNILNDMLQRSDIKYICSQKSRSFHLGKRLRVGSVPKTSSVPDISKMTNDISTNYVLLRMREVFSMEITQILTRFPGESRDHVLKVLTELRKLYRKHGHFTAENGSYLAVCWDTTTIEPAANTNEHNKDSNSIWVHIKTAIKLFANPLFVLTCFCRAVHFITFVPVITTIVDVTIDKGLKEEDGKYVIAALSLGDLVGRLCFGWVTDKGFMSLPRFMLVVMVVQGANCATLPLMKTELAIYLSLGLFGMLQGSLFVRHSVLVLKYLGNHEHSIAMGSINLFSGFLGFVLPLYIGYFRDTLGTYDYIFYINGGLCAAIGLLWFFEPYFVHCHSSGENMGNQSA